MTTPNTSVGLALGRVVTRDIFFLCVCPHLIFPSQSLLADANNSRISQITSKPSFPCLWHSLPAVQTKLLEDKYADDSGSGVGSLPTDAHVF